MNNKTRNGIIAVVSIGVLIVLLKKYVMKSGSTKFNADDLPNKGGGGNQGGGNQGGGNQGGGLDLYALSDNLFEYMDGYGTNYSSIFDILGRMRNQTDWDGLKRAYGSRKLSSGAGNIFAADFTGDLNGALKSELNSSEYKKAQSILSSKGIRF